MNTRSSAVLIAVCLSATSLIAAPPADRVVRETALTVSVDANGVLRQSTVEEQRALASQAVAAPSIMRMPVALANGAVVAPVDESFDHLFVAQTDEAGNIIISCTDDHHAAAAISSANAPVDTILRLKPRMARLTAEME